VSNRNWYQVSEIAPGVTMIAEPLHSENVKSYLVEGERYVAVIDSGLGVGDFRGLAASLSDREPLMLLTHAHWDHIGAAWQFPKVFVHPSEAYAVRRGFPNAMMSQMFEPEVLHRPDLPAGFDPATADIPGREPDGELNDGDHIDLGGRVLEITHTPGHSPGRVSFFDRESGFLFAGDALNYGDVWLYLPRSDAGAFRETLARLAALADDPDLKMIYPSHFDVPLDPAHVHDARAAFDDVWNGTHRPDRHADIGIGFPQPVACDIFDCGRFTFILATGRYGDDAVPAK